MNSIRTGLRYKSFPALLAGVLIYALCFADDASAQRSRAVIDAGTTIAVRTTETINAKDSDGRVFTGVVDQDVVGRNGVVAIPRGSDVELVVKSISDNEVALDLDAVMINQQRFGV